MAATKSEMDESNPKINEKIFLLCDRCFWTVTSLTKKYLDELTEISETEYSCPVCNQEPLSSFPVSLSDSYTYSYTKNKGLEVALSSKKY
jgi:hypothetical protein